MLNFFLLKTFAQHQQDATVNILARVQAKKKRTEEFSPCSWERGVKLIAETILPLHHRERAAEKKKKRSLSAVRKCVSGFFCRVQIVIHVCISFLIIFLRAAPAHCACFCSQQNRAQAQVDIPTRLCFQRKKCIFESSVLIVFGLFPMIYNEPLLRANEAVMIAVPM